MASPAPYFTAFLARGMLIEFAQDFDLTAQIDAYHIYF
jgi:hypothetical protein